MFFCILQNLYLVKSGFVKDLHLLTISEAAHVTVGNTLLQKSPQLKRPLSLPVYTMAHAIFMSDNYVYDTDKLGIFNTYCFVTPKMVTRTRISVMPYLLCLTISYPVPWELPFLLCFSIFPPFRGTPTLSIQIRQSSPCRCQHKNTLFLCSPPTNLP